MTDPTPVDPPAPAPGASGQADQPGSVPPPADGSATPSTGASAGLPTGTAPDSPAEKPAGSSVEETAWSQVGLPVESPTNGLAVAALILGILPGMAIGVVVGILGVNRADKIGGKGKRMAWAGIVLSVLWLVGVTIWAVEAAGKPKAKVTAGASATPTPTPTLTPTEFPSVTPSPVAGSDPACNAGERDIVASTSKITQDTEHTAALKADLNEIIGQLTVDATQSTDPVVTQALNTLRDDYKLILTDVNSGKIPTQAQSAKFSADVAAVTAACS